MAADEEWTTAIDEFSLMLATSVSTAIPLEFPLMEDISLISSATGGGGGGTPVCEDDRPDTGMLYPRG